MHLTVRLFSAGLLYLAVTASFMSQAIENKLAQSYWAHIVVQLSEPHKLQRLTVDAQQYRLADNKILLRQEFRSINDYQAFVSNLEQQPDIATFTASLLVEDEQASYQARQYRLKPQQRHFIKVQRLYLVSGHKREIADLMAKYKAAFTANNIKRDVFIYRGISGQDLPYMEIVRFAKTEQDDIEYEEKVNQAFGKALLLELSTSFGKFIRKGDASLNGIKITPLN